VDGVRLRRWIVPLAGSTALLHSAQPVRRAPPWTRPAGPTPRTPPPSHSKRLRIDRQDGDQGYGHMKTIVGMLIGATLAVGSGCARSDWIDRTLVTVDVTGTWRGIEEGMGREMSFELEQRGSTVKGYIRASSSNLASIEGPIDGTVAGDMFSFRNTRGDVVGELRVNGDEMTGTMSRSGTGMSGGGVGMSGGAGARPTSLRRVDSSSRPGSPPR